MRLHQAIQASLLPAAFLVSTSDAAIIAFTQQSVWELFSSSNGTVRVTETFDVYASGPYGPTLSGSAGSVGWTLAASVGDPAAARLLGWLALSVLVLTGLLGAALLATMTLWMLAEHPQDETRSPSSAPRPASEATPATSSQEEARNEQGSRP